LREHAEPDAPVGPGRCGMVIAGNLNPLVYQECAGRAISHKD
jgi:hypothetical protein